MELFTRRGLFLNIWVERGINNIWEYTTSDENQLKKLVSRGMWVLVMVLVGHGRNNNRLRVWETVDWMVCYSDCKHLHERLLPEMHQFSELDDKESVILNPIITVYTLKKKENIKVVSVLTILSSFAFPRHRLN